jgi:hypothetical protein
MGVMVWATIVDRGSAYYEERNRQLQIEFVRKKAAQLGLRVTVVQRSF